MADRRSRASPGDGRSAEGAKQSIEDAVVARALQWCAEAGRRTSEADVREALGPLRWDELLHVKALLADPPPARPLGPRALADMGRGTPAEVAAERERAGQYRAEGAAPPETPGEVAPQTPKPPRAKRAKRPVVAGPIIHRAADRVPAAPPAPPQRPLFDALFAAEGRGELERLLRVHGAHRVRLLGALAAGWRTPSGAPPASGDLDRLLEAHGMLRAFERRERDLAMHELRAAGGSRLALARALGVEPPALPALLERLGLSAEEQRFRGEKRAALLGGVTLAARARLWADQRERLADLGALPEVEADLAARLPEHVKALRAAGERSLAGALGRTLSLTRDAVMDLARRFGVDVRGERPGGAPPTRREGGLPPGRNRPPPRSAPSRGAPAKGPPRGPRRPAGGVHGSGARGKRPSGRPPPRKPLKPRRGPR